MSEPVDLIAARETCAECHGHIPNVKSSKELELLADLLESLDLDETFISVNGSVNFF
jgi:hypothetical protein